MAIVMGIDPGNETTALSLLQINMPGVFDSEACKKKNDKDIGPVRWQTIRDRMEVKITSFGPSLVCLEDYAAHSQGKVISKFELGGILRLSLFENGVEYILVNPMWTKKFAMAVEKEDIKLQVYKRWNVELPTHDETDAFVLAKIAEAIYLVRQDEGFLEQYTKQQQEVVLDLMYPERRKKKTKKGTKKG